MGAETSGTYWGSLGYKNSGSATYGVYGSAGYASGGGYLNANGAMGIGWGSFTVPWQAHSAKVKYLAS